MRAPVAYFCSAAWYDLTPPFTPIMLIWKQWLNSRPQYKFVIWPSWPDGLQARMHPNKAIVALAAKMARIVWVVLTKPGALYERRDPAFVKRSLLDCKARE